MTRAPNIDLDQLKQQTSILDLLERYGIETQRQGNKHMARCPFHEDNTPSLSVDPIKNLWHCFGCDKGGSVIDLVAEKEGIGFKEAVNRLLVDSGVMVRASTLEKPRPKAAKESELSFTAEDRKRIGEVIDFYHRSLQEDRKALDYLKRRHIADPETLKAFKVGYCNGTVKKVLPKAAVPALKKIGLLRKDGGEVLNGCIVIPVFAEDGSLGECFARFIVDREPTNHLYLPGPHRGVLNAKALEVYADDAIILTEAAFDALTFYAHGIRNVVACYGTGGFTPDHRTSLTRHQVQKVVIAFDADDAGDNAAHALAEELTALGIDCHRARVAQLDRPDGDKVKDVNEYAAALYRQGMPKGEVADALRALVDKARRFGHTRPRKGKGALSLVDQTETDLVFRNCDLNYRLRGLFENAGSSLRVILSAGRDELIHTDRFDLYAAKSRAGFAHRAANRLELPAAKIDEDLNALIPLLEALLAEGKGQADTSNEPPPMSETERTEALRLLRSKNLLRRLSTDLETVGYVGEDRNKQLAYLIATSRKLRKPLSAIIRSESGAGKSFLMECVAELMPPEEVQYFSRLTPQSLYYMGENELVHKLLIVDERDGSEEAEYPIRTLQTRRKLTLAVPMKDAASGKIKTTMLTINGPIAYMESSTQQKINPENLNRCFELYLDESEAQTQRIYRLQKKAHTPEGWAVDERRAAAMRRHHNAQRLLAPVRVSIPYTKQLRFPASWTRGRRDHQRLLHLIEAVAFLHQAQRERQRTEGGEEYIEASLDDYASAYELARAAFAQALADMPRQARLVLTQVREMVRDAAERLNLAERDYGFRRRDVREYARLPDHQIKRAMRTLEELEYVTVRRSGRGGSFVYRLAADPGETDPLEGLTTPEELRQACATD